MVRKICPVPSNISFENKTHHDTNDEFSRPNNHLLLTSNWKRNRFLDEKITSQAVYGSYLFIGTQKGNIYRYNLANGLVKVDNFVSKNNDSIIALAINDESIYAWSQGFGGGEIWSIPKDGGKARWLQHFYGDAPNFVKNFRCGTLYSDNTGQLYFNNDRVFTLGEVNKIKDIASSSGEYLYVAENDSFNYGAIAKCKLSSMVYKLECGNKINSKDAKIDSVDNKQVTALTIDQDGNGYASWSDNSVCIYPQWQKDRKFCSPIPRLQDDNKQIFSLIWDERSHALIASSPSKIYIGKVAFFNRKIFWRDLNFPRYAIANTKIKDVKLLYQYNHTIISVLLDDGRLWSYKL